jgi:hypothetical protein
MRNQKGYVAGYNGQLVVTAQQVIVGAMLSQHPGRPHPAAPLPGQCRDQLAAAGIRPDLRTVLTGSGYVTRRTSPAPSSRTCDCRRRWAKIPPPAASALPSGPGTWTGFPPPHAPSGGCATTVAAPVTSSAPRLPGQCLARSRPA